MYRIAFYIFIYFFVFYFFLLGARNNASCYMAAPDGDLPG